VAWPKSPESPNPTSRRSRIKPKAGAPSRGGQRALPMQAPSASTAARPTNTQRPSPYGSAATLTGRPAGPANPRESAKPQGGASPGQPHQIHRHLKTIVSKASGDVLVRRIGPAECSNEPRFMLANAAPLNPRLKPACESLFWPRRPRRLASGQAPQVSPCLSAFEFVDELPHSNLKVSRSRVRIPTAGGDANAKPLDLVLVVDRFSMGILAFALVSADRRTAEVVSTLLNRGTTKYAPWRMARELMASGKGVSTPLLAR